MNTTKKTKCVSVRLKELVSISDKAYRATDFNGNTDILPKSQVFGADTSVQNSDAYWVSEWILLTKNLTYGSKTSFFDKFSADSYGAGSEVTAVVHTPEDIAPIENAEIADEFKRDIAVDTTVVAGFYSKEVWEDVKAKGYTKKQPFTKWFPFMGEQRHLPKHIDKRVYAIDEESDTTLNWLVITDHSKNNQEMQVRKDMTLEEVKDDTCGDVFIPISETMYNLFKAYKSKNKYAGTFVKGEMSSLLAFMLNIGTPFQVDNIIEVLKVSKKEFLATYCATS